MPISAKRKLVAGAAGLVVLAGTGGAYAANQTGTSKTATPPKPADRAAEQQAFLDDVAGRLHVTADQLTAALKGAAADRIDAAVKAGKLTQAQGDEAKKRIESANGPLLGVGPLGGRGPGGHGPGGPGGPGPRGFGGPFGGLDGAATYLGLTGQQLREKLRSGQSLADIAKATNGKTVDGLKAALKDALTKRLDQAVKDGHLTSAQRDKLVNELSSHLDDIVNNTPPKGGPRAFKHRWR
jgi:polyhydroxyalkanoate synthesis regulator phasin